MDCYNGNPSLGTLKLIWVTTDPELQCDASNKVHLTSGCIVAIREQQRLTLTIQLSKQPHCVSDGPTSIWTGSSLLVVSFHGTSSSTTTISTVAVALVAVVSSSATTPVTTTYMANDMRLLLTAATTLHLAAIIP